MINSAVAGQAKLESTHYYAADDSVRAIGGGTNENGDTVRIDRKKSLADLGATKAQIDTVIKGASIVAALLGGFEGGDVSKVIAGIEDERAAAVVKETADVIDK